MDCSTPASFVHEMFQARKSGEGCHFLHVYIYIYTHIHLEKYIYILKEVNISLIMISLSLGNVFGIG